MSEKVTRVRLSAQVDEYEAAMLRAARATRTVGTEAERMLQKSRRSSRSVGPCSPLVGLMAAGVGVAVQLVTWSDYSEGGEYAPSAASGMVNLDLSAFYMTKWKTGEYPPVLRDAGYLSYKSTLAGTTYTAPEQTTFMYQRALSGRSPVSYLVELLLFLTAPAHVVLRIGSATYEYDATPEPETGIHIATRAAQAGAVSFEVTRGGQLVTEMAPNVQIRSVHATDNPGYFRFSSLRSRAGQFDPLAQFI